ncbi:MAG: hypothetical protein A3J81_04915 [Nitrospirae bacterium RIFOXYB2_FULL_43_5]|nr:MAG: hypothetical protein A3J81_04915 [Nitrospirae bacterium RIFOXYB2_FULL_43_5]
MNEKKQKSNFWIGANHWAWAGLLFPLLFTIVLGVPFIFLAPWRTQEAAAIIISVILLASIWVGTIFSAKRITKKFDIKEADKVVNWAAVWYIVLDGLDRISKMFKPGGMTKVDEIYTVCVIAGFIIFYFLSKKYIKNSEESTM